MPLPRKKVEDKKVETADDIQAQQLKMLDPLRKQIEDNGKPSPTKLFGLMGKIYSREQIDTLYEEIESMAAPDGVTQVIVTTWKHGGWLGKGMVIAGVTITVIGLLEVAGRVFGVDWLCVGTKLVEKLGFVAA